MQTHRAARGAALKNLPRYTRLHKKGEWMEKTRCTTGRAYISFVLQWDYPLLHDNANELWGAHMAVLARLPYVVSNSKPRRVVLRTAPNAASPSRMRVFLHLCFTPNGTNRVITACAWLQIGLLLTRQQRGQDRHWLAQRASSHWFI